MIIGNPDFTKTIEEMNVGEEGYTHPWALMFDLYKNPYLDLNAFVTESPKLISMMPIKRFGLGQTDYDICVDFEYEEEKYDWIFGEINFENLLESGMNFVKLPFGFLPFGKESKFENFLIQRREIAIRNEEYELAAKIRDRLNGKRSHGKDISDNLAKKVSFIEEKKK